MMKIEPYLINSESVCISLPKKKKTTSKKQSRVFHSVMVGTILINDSKESILLIFS